MKITITGSLGHISKPLTEILVKEGHTVTVISSNPEKKNDIEAMGAIAAIGRVDDAAFLTSAFTGADAVYCMEPPPGFFDASVDVMKYYNSIGESYVAAIKASGVKRVVHLSSIGGHMSSGNGLLLFHYNVEKIFSQLPADIAVTTMRPVGFYYNLLAFIPAIKAAGVIATNYDATYKEPWVAPKDIATAVAEEITKEFTGRKVRYMASDELTSAEIAATLGKAIGKPDLKWVKMSDEEQEKLYLSFGMTPQIAKGLTEMNAARETGVLFEDYFKNRPVLGETKLKEFAKDFAASYDRGESGGH